MIPILSLLIFVWPIIINRIIKTTTKVSTDQYFRRFLDAENFDTCGVKTCNP